MFISLHEWVCMEMDLPVSSRAELIRIGKIYPLGHRPQGAMATVYCADQTMEPESGWPALPFSTPTVPIAMSMDEVF